MTPTSRHRAVPARSILRADHRAGSRLPSAAGSAPGSDCRSGKLVAHSSTSSATVREALRVLESDGVVPLAPGTRTVRALPLRPRPWQQRRRPARAEEAGLAKLLVSPDDARAPPATSARRVPGADDPLADIEAAIDRCGEQLALGYDASSEEQTLAFHEAVAPSRRRHDDPGEQRGHSADTVLLLISDEIAHARNSEALMRRYLSTTSRCSSDTVRATGPAAAPTSVQSLLDYCTGCVRPRDSTPCGPPRRLTH